MNLYIRLLRTLLLSWLGPKASMLDELRLSYRVWPLDLDFNLHMNNGRYLTMMDLGRMQLLVRSGLFKHVLANGWMPVVGTVNMRFRRSLSPFQKYILSTRLHSWDEKWFYIEQRFLVGEEVYAVGMVKALILGKGKPVPMKDMLAKMGVEVGPSAPPPHHYFPS